MARDTLQIVAWLRQRGVDEVRQALAESVSAAALADTHARAAEREIEQETQHASDPDGDDALVEAFAAWLPAARLRAVQARQVFERCEADVGLRRAELAACRSALEAINTMIEQRRLTELSQEARRVQRLLDELGGRGMNDDEPRP